MEKNNVESVCLFLQLLKLRVQKIFIKKELKKYTWQQTVKRTLQVHDALQSSLTSLQEAELDQPIPSLPVWQQYMNILLHDAYHTGQIIQLRKLQGSWPTHRSYL
ncbi:serine/threonine protein phosphatase [Bacillus toyonensis]|uniref:hypothetical protein n=1 Tax=Bacillus cereus group TaxID=86661 RepID=UPI00028AF148|nr:hypothetical protein MC28_2175 [Bacillus thuringiensis MC28]MDO8160351.1 serine/threonine protein phosphatase [Bacillus toyonensis]OTX11613.1 serine/threonine protein phosphatase [Bacillus thuringiensis serovar seoulensis]PHC44881.1 serine/threonine protein phosphatase [Bacillus toyonensis]QPW48076.1 serine/threonine protein phosphatase [Bacillus thuringiensis]